MAVSTPPCIIPSLKKFRLPLPGGHRLKAVLAGLLHQPARVEKGSGYMGEAVTGELQEGCAKQPAQLAVFDFDGTSITGNSPVILVKYLARRRMLGKRNLVKIGSWAFCYKFRLPQNESWVRSLVFSAFEGTPVAQADAFLRDFYDQKIEGRFRKKAHEAMKAHRDAGHVVVVVSASFEPIILRAMESHPIDLQVSTRMRVAADGTYTREVEGLPVEGAEKLAAVTRLANETFGEGCWELAYAYGDHHSDRTILRAAKTAYAVTPDNPLERTAKAQGWDILNWA